MKATTLITISFLLVTSIMASPVNTANENAAAVVGCDGDCCYTADGICYPTSSFARRDGESFGTNEDIIGSVSGNILQRPDGPFDFVTAWIPVGEHGGNGKESVWAGKKQRSLTGMGKGDGEGGEGVQDEEQNSGDDNEDQKSDDDGDESSNDDDSEVNDEEEDHGALDDAEDDADDGSDDDEVYSILPIPTATTQTLFAKRGGPGPNFETERPIPTTQTATDGRMPTLTMCWV